MTIEESRRRYNRMQHTNVGCATAAAKAFHEMWGVWPWDKNETMEEKEIHFTDAEGNVYSANLCPTVVATDPKVVWADLWSIPVKDVDTKYHTTIMCRPAHNGEEKDRLQFFETENELLYFINEWPLRRLEG